VPGAPFQGRADDLLSIPLTVILAAGSRSEQVTHRLDSFGLAGRQIIKLFPVDLHFEDLGASIGRLDQFATRSLDAAELAREARRSDRRIGRPP
jgi:hypothetical protein